MAYATCSEIDNYCPGKSSRFHRALDRSNTWHEMSSSFGGTDDGASLEYCAVKYLPLIWQI